MAEKETIIAVLMALVAMLGMVTAYRTATAEEDVSLKESKLTQSRFLELTKREELLVRFSDSARFEVAKDAHLKRARELQGRAEKIRSTDRGKASLLELQAQEEVSLARIQQPYLDFTEVPGVSNKSLTINQIVDRQVAAELAESGLGSKWNKNDSIWQSLEEQIKTSRTKLKWLAFAVVVFVIALGCLSLGELWCRRRGLRLRMMVLGMSVALAAAICVSVLDHAGFWYLLGCIVVFAVLWPFSKLTHGPLQRISQVLATRMGFMSVEETEESESVHPPEPEPRLFAGARNTFGISEESVHVLCRAADCAGRSPQRVGQLSLYGGQHLRGQKRGKCGRKHHQWPQEQPYDLRVFRVGDARGGARAARTLSGGSSRARTLTEPLIRNRQAGCRRNSRQRRARRSPKG